MSVEKFPTWGRYEKYDRLYFQLMARLTGIEGWFAGMRQPDLWSDQTNHQTLIKEVCRLTELTPKQWEELSQSERCPWLEHALESLAKNERHVTDVPVKDSPSVIKQSNVSLDAQALAVFIEHPAWTKGQIAEHLKCHVKSLAPKRCPKLDAAIAAYNAKPTGTTRGTKDASGNVEAWKEEG